MTFSMGLLYVLASVNFFGWCFAASYGWWVLYRGSSPRGRIRVLLAVAGLMALLWVTR